MPAVGGSPGWVPQQEATPAHQGAGLSLICVKVHWVPEWSPGEKQGVM